MLTIDQITTLNHVLDHGSATDLRSHIAPHITPDNMTHAMLILAWQIQRPDFSIPLQARLDLNSSARDTWIDLCREIRHSRRTTLPMWMSEFVNHQPRLQAIFAEWRRESSAELTPLFDKRFPFLEMEEVARNAERANWQRRWHELPKQTKEELAAFDRAYREHVARLEGIRDAYKPLYEPLITEHAQCWEFWLDELTTRMSDPVLEIALATLRRKNPLLLLTLVELQGVTA